ncbi:type II toxin-antitoxin system RelE/ParE family toxin [Psychrobacter lutiphocae]|uniref:type II toxin-antitoxin system RelE/ParE family toxin n=1 Tax=Psychrobacter lutiphocae TaxID=540500 RepID=UPI000382842D|nr:type II toxin-antitoxin system RelE/ParE family toxin [Psychrobacter lutiphocae]
MYQIRTTEYFDKWLKKLRDRQAVKAILIRLTRAEAGNLGDIKSVGNHISEMRIFVGAGYRLYFTIKGDTVIFMLCGGDKSSQQRDIEKAIEILPTIEDCEIDDENKDI